MKQFLSVFLWGGMSISWASVTSLTPNDFFDQKEKYTLEVVTQGEAFKEAYDLIGNDQNLSYPKPTYVAQLPAQKASYLKYMKYYTNIHVPWAQLYHLNYHFEEGTQPIGYMTFTFLRDGFIRVEPFLRKTYYNTETYTSFIQAICHFADRFVGKGTLCVQRPFRKQSSKDPLWGVTEIGFKGVEVWVSSLEKDLKTSCETLMKLNQTFVEEDKMTVKITFIYKYPGGY